MQNAKETASNIAASAKAGMDKTKAVVQEKVEKMTAHDPIEKDMATQRKEEKITQAEINKQQTREHNASATTGYGHATGVPGTGGMHMPGHGTGHILSGHETTGTGGMHMPGHGTGHILGGHETTGTGGTYGHSAMPGHHGTGHTLGGHGFEGTHLNDTQAGLNSGTHASGFVTGTGGTHGTGHGLGGRVVEGIEKATGIGSGTTGHNTHGTHTEWVWDRRDL